MKKPLSVPAIVGVSIAVIAVLVLVFMKASAPTKEFDPPTNVPKTIPDYVKSQMKPQELEELKKKGYDVSSPNAGGGPSGQPTAPPR